MKILCITENLGSGGAERQLCGLAIELKKKGHDVKVVTYVENQFYQPLLDNEGVSYELHQELWPKYTRVWRMAKLVRKEKADVIISFLTGVNRVMCMAKPLFKARLIVSERNTSQSVSMMDKITYFFYRWADKIVCNSYSQKNFMMNNFPHLKNKTLTITNFVDTEKFKPGQKKMLNEIPQIVTVARYGEQKNCENYFKAIGICKEKGVKAKFHWYGSKSYNTQYYKRIEELYNDLDISDILTLHPQSNNIIDIYQEADAFCLPSYYEGFPNVLCEAMSCGLPVACSNVCDNPYIVKDTKCALLFDPNDPEEIANQLMRLASMNMVERSMIGKDNRNRILGLCSMEHFTSEYENIILKLYDCN